MKLHVLAVGDRMPGWVTRACTDYVQRFPPHCPLDIRAVPTPQRGRNPDISRLREKEYQLLCAAGPKGGRRILLDGSGHSWTTPELARHMDDWMHGEKHVVFMIGGPDGLARTAFDEVREKWSLSRLTLPHGLARVIVVEQLYRALSILSDHPYHRGE